MRPKIRVLGIWLLIFILFALSCYADTRPSVIIKNEGFISERLPLSFDEQNLPIVAMKIGSKTARLTKNSYPDELHLDSWNKLSFSHNHIGIVLKGRLGEKGKQLQFCLDSGFAAVNQGKSYGMIRPRYVSKSDLIKQDGNKYTATTHFYLDGMDLGPMEFMVSNFKQPPVAGFIGHNVFIHYRVFIDFDRELLYLKEA